MAGQASADAPREPRSARSRRLLGTRARCRAKRGGCVTHVITVVLAAGKGERLGGPKALLAWPSPDRAGSDHPLAIAHADARLAAESERVLIVTRRVYMRSLLA